MTDRTKTPAAISRWAPVLLIALVGGCDGDPGAPEPTDPTVTERDEVQALFFGSGPLGAGACPASQRWTGFPRGSQVVVTVSTTVSIALPNGSAADPVPGNNSDTDHTTIELDPDLIFSDGFESGDTTRWSTVN